MSQTGQEGTPRDRGRALLAQAIIAAAGAAGLPLNVPGYYTEVHAGIPVLTYRYPGGHRVAIFVTEADYEERLADAYSEFGREIHQPATDEEWLELQRHVPTLIG